MATSSLQRAKTAKNDEFYTQLKDIENELKHYRDQLKNKVIFCNCDDPFESNFFKYFAMNFKTLGLRKLITTCYDPSPVANKEIQLSFFGDDKNIKHNNKNRNKIISKAYKIELDDISDIDGSGNINILDTKENLLREKAKLDNGGKSKILSYLKGSGDFRSDECVELLKRSDIVITNPPFSLFREYVAQLVEYDKKFLIIGSKNAITYKEIFPLIAQNKLWLGHGFNAGNAFFSVPNTDVDRFAKGVYDEKTGLVKFRNCGWFTNLDHEKRHEDLISQLYKKYNSEEYPKYDNYDAINVDKVAEIPEDYDGVMGVPITFLDRYNPDQFEIVAFRKGDDGKDLVYSFRQDKTRQDKTNPTILPNTRPPISDIQQQMGPEHILTDRKNMHEFLSSTSVAGMIKNTEGKIGKKITYARITIRRIK